MIELVDLKSPRAVGVRVAGNIDKKDIEKVFKAIDEKLDQAEKVGIYVELESFGGISFDALIDDIKFALPNINRFDKKAVVSGEEWVERTVDFVDRIFTGIKVRHFSLDEKEQAKKWVAE